MLHEQTGTNDHVKVCFCPNRIYKRSRYKAVLITVKKGGISSSILEKIACIIKKLFKKLNMRQLNGDLNVLPVEFSDLKTRGRIMSLKLIQGNLV